MPSASLRSRINAFESLAAVSPQNPSYTSKRILETSSAFSYAPIKPLRSPSPSPQLGRKTSLIDLKDWVVDDSLFTTRQHGFGNKSCGSGKTLISGGFDGHETHPPKLNTSAGILINFDMPPKQTPPKAPPLPPRKESYNSLKSVSSVNSPNITNDSFTPSNTLAVEHTYPPSSTLDVNDGSRRAAHASASSVSSFHSVSLSSDGGTTDPSTPDSVSNFIATLRVDREGGEADAVGLDESFEDVSTSSIASPTTAGKLISHWRYPTPKRHPDPPRLPQRPSITNTPSPPYTSVPPKSPPRPSSSSSARRPAPPPPSQMNSRPPSVRTSLSSTIGSDRSSTTSTLQFPAPQALYLTNRLTPVPVSVRTRYEKVFVANILYQRKQAATNQASFPKKQRQAVGWRGLSVDLLMNPDGPVGNDTPKESVAEQVEDVVGPDERLDGCIIKVIWSASKLDREKLRDIWNECDATGQGALDRGSFVTGMWRIDEELRKAKGKPSSSVPSRKRSPPQATSHKPILH